jgi:hypothetical protein
MVKIDYFLVSSLVEVVNNLANGKFIFELCGGLAFTLATETAIGNIDAIHYYPTFGSTFFVTLIGLF